MKSEESGSTLRTAIQPPHLDIRRRSPSQGESEPVIIGLSHRADSGGGGLGPRNQQPRAGREYRIDRPPCLTNPRPQGFSLPLVFQPHIPAEPRHSITRSSLTTAVQSSACRVASPPCSACSQTNSAPPNTTRNVPLIQSGEPHNRLLTSRDGAARERLTEIALASYLVYFPGMETRDIIIGCTTSV